MADGDDLLHRDIGQSDKEVADATAEVAASGRMTLGVADLRARASRKRDEAVAAAATAYGGSVQEKTSTRRAAEPRASGKRRRHEEVAGFGAEDSKRTATVDESPPSIRRRFEEVRAAAPEEEEAILGSPRVGSEVVRAHHVLSLPEHLTARIIRCLPRQMAMWRIDHQPASLCFHLRDGLYPSPDDLTVLLNKPQLVRICRFSLVVYTDEVSDRHMAGYLTRASECRTEELRLEYAEAVDNIFIFMLAGCNTCLRKLILKNVRIDSGSLSITPVFSNLSVMQLFSVPLGSMMLTQIVALCPALSTLSLHNIQHLDEIVFEPTASRISSLRITMCSVRLLHLEELCGLRSFLYYGRLPQMHFDTRACLEELFLCSWDEEYPGDPFSWLETAPDLSVLSHLTLSSPALSSVTAKNLYMHRLEELQVIFDSQDYLDRSQFIEFLHGTRFPKLNRLFLQLGQSNVHLEMRQEDPQDDPEIELKNLYLVRAELFDGSSEQMILLNTVLMNAPRLKYMVLSSTADNAGLQMKVHILKQCSETAEVVLIQGEGSWPCPRHIMPCYVNPTADAE